MCLRDCLRRDWTSAGLPDSQLHILDWQEHEASLCNLPELPVRVHGWVEAFHLHWSFITYFHVLSRNHKTVDQAIRPLLQKAGNA